MKPTRQQLFALLRSVAATEPEEIDCDEFLARVGPLLEACERRDELRPELRIVAQHLEVCPPCKEEFEALVQLRFEP